MASAGSLADEQAFQCSICLSVFTKPVSLLCGHNFCLRCITQYWDSSDPNFQCPVCRRMFPTRPMLQVNTLIAEMIEKPQRTMPEKSPATAEQAGTVVLCGVCTGTKVKALKSCIQCVTSYCGTHLEPHETFSTLKKHKLINPVENLAHKICKVHGGYFELFCVVDQKFACEACKERDHKKHKVVTLEEAAQMKKKQLGEEKTRTTQMIRARQRKIQEIQQSVEASRNNATDALSCSTDVMTAVADFVRRSQAELAEAIETSQRKTENEAEGLIKGLEVEIMQTEQKILQLDEVSLADGPFAFLQKYLSLTITQPQVKDLSHVTLESDPFPMQDALAKMETTVMKGVRALCDPDLKEKRRHAVDVTLDPDTANPYLTVSADGKQVTHGNKKRNVSGTPGRFDQVFNVLAKEGFSSGKFYYEVQVKDKTHWIVGVVNQSINRKGDLRLSPKIGYWTICLRKGPQFTVNTSPATNLDVRKKLHRVGVFVDYKEGQVSFYDVDARANIFSFTGCNFTERLFPFFSPCAKDGDKDSAPLIITPVKYNS